MDFLGFVMFSDYYLLWDGRFHYKLVTQYNCQGGSTEVNDNGKSYFNYNKKRFYVFHKFFK